MKILDILPIKNESTFPYSLLSSGIQDDYLFDTVFFQIVVEPSPADYVNYFYRLLWETCYIKSKLPSNDTSHSFDTKIVFNISLSEAMGFINKATPPLLRKKIDEIKTENDVVDALKVFLMEDNKGEQVHYTDIFRDHVKFKVFETNESLDANAMDKLDRSTSHGFTIKMISSNTPFNIIFSTGGVSMLCMIRSNGPDDLKHIKDMICDDFIKVSNVSIKSGKVYIRISCLCHEMSGLNKIISQSMKECYKKFL